MGRVKYARAGNEGWVLVGTSARRKVRCARMRIRTNLSGRGVVRARQSNEVDCGLLVDKKTSDFVKATKDIGREFPVWSMKSSGFGRTDLYPCETAMQQIEAEKCIGSEEALTRESCEAKATHGSAT